MRVSTVKERKTKGRLASEPGEVRLAGLRGDGFALEKGPH